MIDLILWGPNKATFVTFAVNQGLLIETQEEVEPGVFETVRTKREGFDYCWWAGSGKLMTDRGSQTDPETDPGYVPPTFLNGEVALLRIYGNFFQTDKIDGGPVYDEEGNLLREQHDRSKVAQYIRNNGTPGTVAGGSINYYEVDGIRIFRAKDVQDWLAANNLPGHIWLGGNSY